MLSDTPTANATAAKTIDGMGTKTSVPLPMAKNAAGYPGMAGPFVITRQSPLNNCIVPSVARMGVMPTRAISHPLMMPQKIPVARAAPMAPATQSDTCAVVASAGTARVRIRAASIPERFATPITDKSMPPVISESMMASEKIPNSGN